MKKRIARFALLMVATFLVPEISQARWMNPQSGRFQTMDSYEGSPSDPSTFHKYAYCSADPVNGTDRSGFWREIDSNFAAGKDAETPVIADFVARRGVQNAAVLKSIHGILGYLSNTGYKGLGRLLPDLVDVNKYEIYDVKSWKETMDGMIKIQTYAYAFNQADPDPARATKWHAGLTYNYSGPNPSLLPGTSNGKQVWAMYYPTAAGVVPYKLYEVDDDNDRKRIPIPVPIRVRQPQFQYKIDFQPIGTLIYANYYARNAGRNLAIVGTAGLAIYMGIATLNSSQGAP